MAAATNDPQMEPHFKVNRWNENTIEQIKTELIKAISGDPQISDPSGIGLEVHTTEKGVDRIRLVGSAKDDGERQRAARVVVVNTRDEVVVQNELTV